MTVVEQEEFFVEDRSRYLLLNLRVSEPRRQKKAIDEPEEKEKNDPRDALFHPDDVS